jgi:hypothetical protein
MCIVQLPPGGNPLAVNKYIISYVNINMIYHNGMNFTKKKEYPILTYIVDIVLLTIPAAEVLLVRFGGNSIKHDKRLKLEK